MWGTDPPEYIAAEAATQPVNTFMDWESDQTYVLLNPRMPEIEKKQADDIQKSLPHLPSHVWLLTSGSTARHKWVALSKNAILTSAAAVNAHLESDRRDCWLNPLPRFHVGGLGILARSYLSGARSVDCAQSKWNAQHFYARLLEEKATLTALVPAQIFDLIQLNVRAPTSLKAAIVGGGVLHPKVYEKAFELGWTLLPSYGMTECASQIATASLHECKNPALKILPHFEVRIDHSGLIALKGESLLTGYAITNSKGLEFYDPKKNGWLITEDRGSVKGSFLEVHGREKSFIKIGGESVNFAQLELLLEGLRIENSINVDVALVPMPDERLGHVIHLATTQVSSEVEKLINAFQLQVCPFEAIRKVHYISYIPRSAIGKIRYDKLINEISVA